MQGYLIAERQPREGLLPHYMGVFRVPDYWLNDERPQAEFLDEYLLGDVIDDETNLIPTLRAAMKVAGLLPSSLRSDFEIIYVNCLSDEPPTDITDELKLLGVDVACVTGDRWTIVGDLAIGKWAEPFRRKLNANGLFRDRQTASEYLDEYSARRGTGSGPQFQVAAVFRVASWKRFGILGPGYSFPSGS